MVLLLVVKTMLTESVYYTFRLKFKKVYEMVDETNSQATNSNVQTADDGYEYEYIELAEGEELPEDAEYEYEYVEVPVEDDAQTVENGGNIASAQGEFVSAQTAEDVSDTTTDIPEFLKEPQDNLQGHVVYEPEGDVSVSAQEIVEEPHFEVNQPVDDAKYFENGVSDESEVSYEPQKNDDAKIPDFLSDADDKISLDDILDDDSPLQNANQIVENGISDDEFEKELFGTPEPDLHLDDVDDLKMGDSLAEQNNVALGENVQENYAMESENVSGGADGAQISAVENSEPEVAPELVAEEAAPMPEPEVAPEPVAEEAAPMPEPEAAPEPVAEEAAPMPEPEVAPEPVAEEAAPMPEPKAAPEPVAEEAAPMPEPEAVPEPVAEEVTPMPEPEAAPESVTEEAVPMPEPEVAPELVTEEAAPMPEPEVAPEPVAEEAAPMPEPEAALEPVSEEAAPMPEPEAAPEPVSEAVAPMPEPEVAPEPVAEAVAPMPEPEVAPEPVVEAVAPMAEPEVAPEPVAEVREEQVAVREEILPQEKVLPESQDYQAPQTDSSVEVSEPRDEQVSVSGLVEENVPIIAAPMTAVQSDVKTSEQAFQSVDEQPVQVSLYDMSDEDCASLCSVAFPFNKNSGFRGFQADEKVYNLVIEDIDINQHEENDWSLIIFDDYRVRLNPNEKELILPKGDNTVRYAKIMKSGKTKLELFNEEKYNFMAPTEEFVKIRGHYIYGNIANNSKLIVKDFVNISLADKLGKQITFNKPVSGLLTGPKAAKLYFSDVRSVIVPNAIQLRKDEERERSKAARWYSGSSDDKCFEFDAKSQISEFNGTDECKIIHVNVGISHYGWNITFDNGLFMSFRDLLEYQTRYGQLPDSSGVITHGQQTLKFTNVEKIVIYEAAQYFTYG